MVVSPVIVTGPCVTAVVLWGVGVVASGVGELAGAVVVSGSVVPGAAAVVVSGNVVPGAAAVVGVSTDEVTNATVCCGMRAGVVVGC